MAANSSRVKIQGTVGINLTDHPDVLKMIDEMREAATSEGISRASMVRILIKDGYERWKKSKKK